MGAGSGSWKRTVRLGLVVDVEVDVMDAWLEERMEAWSALALLLSLALPQTLLGRLEFIVAVCRSGSRYVVRVAC